MKVPSIGDFFAIVFQSVPFDTFLLCVTLSFVALDIISGLVKAVIEKDIRSGKMWYGILKKTAYLLVMILAILCDMAQTIVDIGFTVPIFAAACVLIILTELASIVENIVAINPELAATPFFKLFNLDHEEGNHDA